MLRVYAIALICLVAGISILAGDRQSISGWLLTNYSLLPVSQFISVFLHEVGHALGARLVGIKVTRMTIGTGRPLFSRQVFGIPLVLFQLPVGGFCYMKAGERVVQNWRWCVAIAAGPAMNILLAGIALWVAGEDGVTPNMRRSTAYLSILFLENVLIVMGNLWPHFSTIEGRRQPSDGLTLLKLCLPRLRVTDTGGGPGLEDLLHRVRKWSFGAFVLVLATVWVFFVVPEYKKTYSDNVSPEFIQVVEVSWVLIAVALIGLAWWAFKEGLKPPSQIGRSKLSFESARMVEMKEMWQLPTDRRFWSLAATFDSSVRRCDFVSARVSLHEFSKFEKSAPIVWLSTVNLAWSEKRFEDVLRIVHDALPAANRGPLLRLTLLQFRWVSMAHLGRNEEIRSELNAFAKEEYELRWKIRILDLLACLPLTDGIASYREESIRWIELALSLQPESLTLLGTKGALLVEVGNWDEAGKLLTRVEAESESHNDQGIASLYLALHARQRGDMKSAARWAKRSRDLCTFPWLVKRLAAEFPALADGTGNKISDDSTNIEARSDMRVRKKLRTRDGVKGTNRLDGKTIERLTKDFRWDFISIHLDEIQTLWPNADDALIQEASTEFRRALTYEDFVSALIAVRRMARGNPDHPTVWFSLIRLQMVQGRTELAVRLTDGYLPKASRGPLTRLWLLKIRWEGMVQLGKYEGVRKEMDSYLDGESDVEMKIWILDAIACTPFMDVMPAYLDEAMRWAEMALSLKPQSLVLLGTKGALLAELGRWPEAEAILSRVAAECGSEEARATASLFLALGAKRRGDAKASAVFARRAQTLSHQQWLQSRILGEFPELGGYT